MTGLKNKKINKILIVKPSSLGDIFHCFPAVSLLHTAFPEAKIDWFVRPEFKDAIDYCPVKINRIINFPRTRLTKFKTFSKTFIKVRNDLRKEKYDLIIDFQGLVRSALFTFLSRSSETAGFSKPKESAASWAYTHKIDIPKECVHAVDRNIALAEAITGLKAPKETPELAQVDKFKQQIEIILKKHNINSDDKLMGIIPGARWESKCWPPEFFADAAAKFLKEHPDYKILIIGAPDDRIPAEKIISKASNKNIISIAGDTSVGEMIEAIRYCKFLLSNDSGPVHIAAALQKTVFALFGPTDPDKTGPYGDFHHIFQRDLDCIKCLKRTCPMGSYLCHDLDISKLIGTLNNYIKNGETHES
jgi:lipopolysaccharide heptosyltransferase I